MNSLSFKEEAILTEEKTTELERRHIMESKLLKILCNCKI
jgi:hypothetical protein